MTQCMVPESWDLEVPLQTLSAPLLPLVALECEVPAADAYLAEDTHDMHVCVPLACVPWEVRPPSPPPSASPPQSPLMSTRDAAADAEPELLMV